MLRRTWPTVKAALAIATLVIAALYSADRLERQERAVALAKRADPVVTGSIIPVVVQKTKH
ncbi:hypothetical protein F6X51_25720 [Methylobacterium planeticum]|uniref:Uncharacterized protein n=1 Tax=Methylobacterium planeticum TaxID=2615211 RepID=A0A6N6MG61_9HYPH|nr:hypothetical protein F6X51_25720 [Methylobacterium planeticum]